MKSFLLILPLLTVLLSGCASNKKPFGNAITSPSPVVPPETAIEGFTNTTAKIRAVKGNGHVFIGSEWIPLKVNQTLSRGNAIQTGPDSTALIFLNNSVVLLMPNSLLTLETLMIQSIGSEKIYRTVLNVNEGKIMGNVKKLARASSYDMKTKKGTARIRGTDFELWSDGRITSIQGAISFITPERELTINTGEFFDPATNESKLLPPEMRDSTLVKRCNCIVRPNLPENPFQSPFAWGIIQAHRNLRDLPMHISSNPEHVLWH